MLLEDREMHYGSIIKDHGVLKTFKSSNRRTLILQINGWFDDYFKENSSVAKELPPLDDWTKSSDSKKGPGNWYIQFPDESWNVLIRYEDIASE